MDLSKFCPRCGEETDELYGNEKKLCKNCYTDVHDLLDIPREVEVTICSVCGRMKKHHQWIEVYTIPEQLAEAFEGFSEEDIEMEIQYWEDEEEEQMYARVHAIKGAITDFYDTKLEFIKTQCPDCSRFQGGFYKVKIQLRGNGDLKDVADFIADQAAELTNQNRKDFLSNIDKVDGGYDFFLSTEEMNKKILSSLRNAYEPDIKRSYELIGETDGEEVYRNVVSVRIEKH